MMNNKFDDQFNSDIEVKIKLNEKITKLKKKDNLFIKKEVNDNSLENLFYRVDTLSLSHFLIPLNINDHYVQQEDEKYYIYLPYLKEDSIQGYDLKLSFYIKAISQLHSKTKIYIKPSDSYFETILNYIENEFKRISSSLESRIEVIERSDYHSPNEWFFLMNYHYLSSSLDMASRHLMNFEGEIKNIDKFKLSLTYQNFNFNHIFIKNQKIISIEKMGYNSPIIDLVDLIQKINNSELKIETYIEEYIKNNPLEEYEKEYMMSLLFIIDYHRYENEKDDLMHLINLVEYIKLVNNIEENIIFSSMSEE